jgi:hypothetical protein
MAGPSSGIGKHNDIVAKATERYRRFRRRQAGRQDRNDLSVGSVKRTNAAGGAADDGAAAGPEFDPPGLGIAIGVRYRNRRPDHVASRRKRDAGEVCPIRAELDLAAAKVGVGIAEVRARRPLGGPGGPGGPPGRQDPDRPSKRFQPSSGSAAGRSDSNGLPRSSSR